MSYTHWDCTTRGVRERFQMKEDLANGTQRNKVDITKVIIQPSLGVEQQRKVRKDITSARPLKRPKPQTTEEDARMALLLKRKRRELARAESQNHRSKVAIRELEQGIAHIVEIVAERMDGLEEEEELDEAEEDEEVEEEIRDDDQTPEASGSN